MITTLKTSKYWYYGPKFDEYTQEKHPNAVFVEEIAIKTSRGYTDHPGVVYYQENPPAPYTNKYFCFFKQRPDPLSDQGYWIIKGLDDFDPVVEGVLRTLPTGDRVIGISRYRHDYFQFTNDGFVDGGRDYTRFGGSSLSDFTIVKVNLLTKQFNLNGEWHDYVR